MKMTITTSVVVAVIAAAVTHTVLFTSTSSILDLRRSRIKSSLCIGRCIP